MTVYPGIKPRWSDTNTTIRFRAALKNNFKHTNRLGARECEFERLLIDKMQRVMKQNCVVGSCQCEREKSETEEVREKRRRYAYLIGTER